MCSATVSTHLPYEAPVLTERCGEVYCSLNLETFFVNCLRCSKEFNLISCNLFIKHIKECIPTADSTIQSNINHAQANKCVGKEDEKDLDSSVLQIDPLMRVKEEGSGEEKCVKENEEVSDLNDGSTCEEAELMSDYLNEDDLPLEKLGRRKIVEGIITEYKKRPVLWDANVRETATRLMRSYAYRRIRKAVNSKYKTNFTDAEVRAQIRSLRCGYSEVLKRRKSFEKLFSGGTMHFNPMLWYFDKISFIQGAEGDFKVDLTENSETEPEDPVKQNGIDDNESADSSCDQPVRESKKAKRERPDSKILTEPNVISEIISQYKQYPFLWDQTALLYNDRYARKDAFRKITRWINQKFHKNVTDKEMRQQIVNMRCVYRRVQRKKHKSDYRVSLWYYDDLSFIDNKANFEENVSHGDNQPPKNEAILDEDCSTFAENFETLDNDCNNESHDDFPWNENNTAEDEQSLPLSCRERNNKKVLSLIEEYKKHPCLWNNEVYKTTQRSSRYNALKKIKDAMNAKHGTSFTETEIRNKIVQLRSSYRRVLRIKEAFERKHANAKRKFLPQLWYFDKLAFIGAKGSDFSISRKKKKKNDGEGDGKPSRDDAADDQHIPSENDSIEIPEQCSAPESPNSGSPKTSIAKKEPLLRAVVEECRKHPCLFEAESDETTRRCALIGVCDTVNQKFNSNLSHRSLDGEINALISAHRGSLQKKEMSPNEEVKSNMWCADLSFIPVTRNPESTASYNKREEGSDLQGHKSVIPEPDTSPEQKVCQSASPVNNKEIVFKIIELYKGATILWDTSHPQNALRSMRKKCIEKIISTLSQEHNCHLTVEEFRYQIRFLKQSYLRALKQASLGSKLADKPFFFEELSFLEPFADKNFTCTPEEQTPVEQPQDFAFLTENKPLMIKFIELYKANGCLWDQNHKDRNNGAAHAVANSEIIKMFQQSGEEFTEERVRSAIQFLHSTAVHPKQTLSGTTDDSPPWFLEHLQFLAKSRQVKDKFCTHCNRLFPSLAKYEKHKIEIAGDYPYKCEICNAGFVSRSKFAYHQVTHKEPYKCDQCNFQAFDKHNFKVHMRRHKGIYLFRCDECDKGFVTSPELTRHLRMHTGERSYICEICGKSLVAYSEYYHHMKRHRNQRDHKCEICGSAFFAAKTLKDHMESHSSERQHVCEVCGSAFKRKKTLHQHKALHLEKKKHECKICGKRFAQKAGVYSHMKSHGQMIKS